MTILKSAVGAIGACLLVASLAACSSSGSKSGGSSTPSDPSSASTSTAGSSSTGKAATGSAIDIGWDNLEAGSYTLPEVTDGFKAALDYVNSELDGVNGHVLKASVLCKADGTPEASVNCANQQVQDKVVLSVQGFDFGADAMLPVLKSAKLATLGGFPLTPGMNAAVDEAYWFVASSQEGYAAEVAEQKNLGTKSLAVVQFDQPSAHDTFNKIIAPAAKLANLKVKAFYLPTQVDWASEAATIQASGVDGISLFTGAAANLAAIQALRSAGFSGQIDAGSDTSILSQLSSAQLKNVNFSANNYTPDFATLPPAIQTQMTAFTKYSAKYNVPSGKQSGAVQGYYLGLMTADVLRQIKAPLTAASVYAAMPTVKGSSEPLRTNGYDCSKPSWPGTAACGTGLYYATPNSDKKLVLLPNQPVDVSGLRPAS